MGAVVFCSAPTRTPPPAVVNAPSLAVPFRMVIPEIVAVTPGVMSNTRSMSLPSTIVVVWPSPVMVRSPVTSRSPIDASGVTSAPPVARV